jgi:hypothetical protein
MRARLTLEECTEYTFEAGWRAPPSGQKSSTPLPANKKPLTAILNHITIQLWN